MYVGAEGYDMVEDEEVEALLERRYRELLARRREAEKKRLEKELEEARRQEILRAILTPEARERLYNIRIVRPEIARIVEDRLIALAVQGKLTKPLTDEELKAILEEIYKRTRKDFRINIREK